MDRMFSEIGGKRKLHGRAAIIAAGIIVLLFFSAFLLNERSKNTAVVQQEKEERKVERVREYNQGTAAIDLPPHEEAARIIYARVVSRKVMAEHYIEESREISNFHGRMETKNFKFLREKDGTPLRRMDITFESTRLPKKKRSTTFIYNWDGKWKIANGTAELDMTNYLELAGNLYRATAADSPGETERKRPGGRYSSWSQENGDLDGKHVVIVRETIAPAWRKYKGDLVATAVSAALNSAGTRLPSSLDLGDSLPAVLEHWISVESNVERRTRTFAADGSLITDWVVDKMDYDQPVSRADFEIPKGISIRVRSNPVLSN